jgi:hypothetical protein
MAPLERMPKARAFSRQGATRASSSQSLATVGRPSRAHRPVMPREKGECGSRLIRSPSR